MFRADVDPVFLLEFGTTYSYVGCFDGSNDVLTESESNFFELSIKFAL